MKRLSIILSLVLATISASSFARSLEFGVSAGVFTTSNYNISGFYSRIPPNGGVFSYTASAHLLYNIDSTFQAGLSVDMLWRLKGNIPSRTLNGSTYQSYDVTIINREIAPLAEFNIKPWKHKAFFAGAALGLGLNQVENGLVYGVQAGYVFTDGKHLGLSIRLAMRHVTSGLAAYPGYRSTISTFTFPLTIGLRYR